MTSIEKDDFPPHPQESLSECGRCSLSPFCQFEVRATLSKSAMTCNVKTPLIFPFSFFLTVWLPIFHAVTFVLVQPAMEGVEVRTAVQLQAGVVVASGFAVTSLAVL